MTDKNTCTHKTITQDNSKPGRVMWICVDCGTEFYPASAILAANLSTDKPIELRDQFAMAALQGRLAAGWIPPEGSLLTAAKKMYQMADACLEARK